MRPNPYQTKVLEPLHGISPLMAGTRHAKLRNLLVQGYHASRTPNEQGFIRLLGQAYFGVDMLYETLPSIWPRSAMPAVWTRANPKAGKVLKVRLPADFKVVDRVRL